MKTLNKVFFVILLSMVTIGFVNAQNIKFGLKGGLNTSSVSGFGDLVGALEGMGAEVGDFSTSYKPGFHLGVVAQIELGSLFLQPELLFSQMGVTGKLEGESENLNLNYLQLPIYVGYKKSVGVGLDLLLGAGPYLGYGISGSEETFGDDGMFKRIDAGLSFMGGIQFNNIQITLGYDLGLIDMVDAPGWNTAKDILGLSSITNRNIKVSFAYFF
ncbi:MAG: PorT family protein [Dysgonamonadaceae bacterium]|jgi:hypothetical protein|nr:PorT family protein [Dysgonamonadaceae bacterium]